MKKSELRNIIKEELSKYYKVGSIIKFNKKIDKFLIGIIINDKLTYKINRISNNTIGLLNTAEEFATIPVNLFNIWLKDNTISIIKH